MAAPLSVPADPIPFTAVWRALSTLRLVRRVLGIPEEKNAVASDACEVDTSLTQAELEVLK